MNRYRKAVSNQRWKKKEKEKQVAEKYGGSLQERKR
jgi:hypothetical protein